LRACASSSANEANRAWNKLAVARAGVEESGKAPIDLPRPSVDNPYCDLSPAFRRAEGRVVFFAHRINEPRRVAIRRPMKSTAAPEKGGPRVNRDIRALQVQLIDAEGKNVGAVEIAEGLRLAEEAGLDLVEIVPNATPPVCKILDFGKFRFLEQKKSSEQRKRQKIVEIKEIKLRPGIDDHDYEVKMRSVRRFFEEGDKVKVTLRFRGREMAHQDIGFKLLQRVKTETAPIAKVEAEPLMEGRQMTMVLAPK
jgi:translation initiation factor IF-3